MARTYSVTQSNNANKQQISPSEYFTNDFDVETSTMNDEDPQLPPALADVLKEWVIPPIDNFEQDDSDFSTPKLLDSFVAAANTLPDSLLLPDSILPMLTQTISNTKPEEQRVLPIVHANQRVLEIISSSSSSSSPSSSSSSSSFSTSSSSTSATSSTTTPSSVNSVPSRDPIMLLEYPQPKVDPSYQYLEQPYLELQYLDPQNLESYLDQSFSNDLPQTHTYSELEQQLYEHPTLSIPEPYPEPDSSFPEVTSSYITSAPSYQQTETYQEPDSTFLDPEPPVLAYLDKPDLYFISDHSGYLHPDFDPESYFEAHLNDPFENEQSTPKKESESDNFESEYEFELPENIEELQKSTKAIVLKDISPKVFSFDVLVGKYPDLVDGANSDEESDESSQILEAPYQELPEMDSDIETDIDDSESGNESDSSITSEDSDFEYKRKFSKILIKYLIKKPHGLIFRTILNTFYTGTIFPRPHRLRGKCI